MKCAVDLMLRLALGLAYGALVAGCGKGTPNRSDEPNRESAIVRETGNNHEDDLKLRARKQLAELNLKVPDDFMRCVRNNDSLAVRLFLEAGMSTEQRDDVDGWTALQHAAYNGNLKMVQLLLDHGANILASRDGDGRWRASEIARERGYREVVELLDAGEKKFRASLGIVPGTYSQVEDTFDGAKTNKWAFTAEGTFRCYWGQMESPDDLRFDGVYHVAGNRALLRYQEMSSGQWDNRQRAITANGLSDKHFHLVKSSGVDEATHFKDRDTALVQENHEKLLASTVAGAAARVRDNAGDDTKSMEIMRAFYRGRILNQWKKEGMSESQVAAMLLSSAAGIEDGGLEVKTPIAIFSNGAAWEKDPRVIFVKKSAQESWQAFVQHLKSAVSVEPKAVNVRDAKANTALIWAVLKNDLDVAKWLMEHGADLNAKNGKGNTALTLAEKGESGDMEALLRQAAPKAK